MKTKRRRDEIVSIMEGNGLKSTNSFWRLASNYMQAGEGAQS